VGAASVAMLEGLVSFLFGGVAPPRVVDSEVNGAILAFVESNINDIANIAEYKRIA